MKRWHLIVAEPGCLPVYPPICAEGSRRWAVSVARHEAREQADCGEHRHRVIGSHGAYYIEPRRDCPYSVEVYIDRCDTPETCELEDLR